MSCNHELNPEYIYPSDIDVLDVDATETGLVLNVALPCPECGQALELSTDVTVVSESDLELPLDDEWYD